MVRLWDWGLFRALNALQNRWAEKQVLAPFDGLVTAEHLAAVRALLPVITAGSYQAESYVLGSFPFEAYSIPETAH